MVVSITFNEFLLRAKSHHGERYDYSQAEKEFKSNRSKITIICPVHGEFIQLAHDHVTGKKCKRCAVEDTILLKQQNYSEKFIIEAREVHGDTYDYSKVKYVSAVQKIIIGCKIHGDFMMRPNAHIGVGKIPGANCPSCAIITRGDNKSNFHGDFITKCKEKYGDRYDYTNTVYTRNMENIKVYCNRHSVEFIQTAACHLRGLYTCEQCSLEARKEKQEKGLEECIEALWTHVHDGVPIYINKDTYYVHGASLTRTKNTNISSWYNKHIARMDAFKESIDPGKNWIIKTVEAGIKITWIHPYFAISYAKGYGNEFYTEILEWLIDVSGTCPEMREMLEICSKVDAWMRNELESRKFFEQGAVSMVKYQLELSGIIVHARESDGYINATQLCKAGGKEFKAWNRLESSKELISYLEKEVPRDLRVGADQHLVEIITSGDNHLRGTWVHPDIAIDIAYWISIEFKVQVIRWTRELMYTGTVSIESKKSQDELLRLQKEFVIVRKENKLLQRKVEQKQKREKFEPGKYLYIVQTDHTPSNRRYKIGKTDNLEARLASYNSLCPSEYVFYIDARSQHIMDSSEIFIHKALIQYRDYANHEYYILPEENTIVFFINKIRGIINLVNDSNDLGTVCETFIPVV